MTRCSLWAFWLLVLVSGVALAGPFEPTWDSLNRHTCPQWWKDAKFGIFIHWGVYSVPAYAVPGTYSEWYLARIRDPKANEDNARVAAYHEKHFPGQSYSNLVAHLTAIDFEPECWADLFKKSGAKYVVLTSKHHEGFCLWPTATAPGWNAGEVGPKRDLCGELAAAVRAEGLRIGFYYSLIEWQNPLEESGRLDEFIARVNFPQMKELVTRYRPDILWTDGDWAHTDEQFQSKAFLTWLYNDSPVTTNIVVNDRWGNRDSMILGKKQASRGHVGDHWTTEYGDGAAGEGGHPWEECRGIGRSFGYNRFEDIHAYLTDSQCVEELVEKVSRGGNLLLNIGPTAEGQIPVIMQERLLAVGEWLKVNGEAIYGTTAWLNRPKTMRSQHLYFTAKGDETLYAIRFGEKTEPFTVPPVRGVRAVTVLGSDEKPFWQQNEDGGLTITPPIFKRHPCRHAIVYRLEISEQKTN